MNIPISRPFFGPEEREAIQRPLDTGWVVQGPHVAEFEARFASWVGSVQAAATSSCTTALHVAVTALGLRPGDEVIVPAFTWVATPNVVEYAGARPIFCDVDLETFNIDVSQIEALITPRTVGIIPVHLFGLAADMSAVMAIAERRALWVVEDAACGFGATVGDRHVGSFGQAGCFSFHPRKSITTGEGGMVTTSDPQLNATVRSLRDHGASRSDLDRHLNRSSYLLSDYDALGFNYRMTDFQGALGCVQLDRAEWILGQRARQAAIYDAELSQLDWLRRPGVPAGYGHGYQSYVCLFTPGSPSLSSLDDLHRRRNRLMNALEQRGIATRQGTHAPVLLGYYRQKYGLVASEYPNAAVADRLSLSLPLFAGLTDPELEQVVAAIKEIGPG